MEKPSTKITILFFLIVVIGALIGFYFYFNVDSGRIPTEDSVVSMTGSLYNRPDSGVDIDEFTIPPDHYEAILNLFQNAQPDSNPAK